MIGASIWSAVDGRVNTRRNKLLETFVFYISTECAKEMSFTRLNDFWLLQKGGSEMIRVRILMNDSLGHPSADLCPITPL